MFNLAIDSKLRGCDLVRLKIDDVRSLVAFGQCHSWARDWLKAEPIYVFVIDEQLADAEKSIEGECFISVS